MKMNSSNRWMLGLALFCSLALVTELARAGGGGGGGGGGRGGGGGGFGGVAGGFGGGGGGGGVGRGGTTGTSGANQLGSVAWSYDPESRTIMAITTSNTASQIDQVIKVMDRPAPQVLIKVVFMEADRSEGLDLGVEGDFTRQFNSKIGAHTPTTAIVSNILGVMPPPSPAGGVYTIAGNDYSVTLRALATAGKLRILSRPSILARNNQTASINLGQTVPIISGTTYNVNIGQINTVTYQSVGIGMQVTPFITEDDNVEMIVTPSITSLADKSLWVTTSPGIQSPVFNSRSADTVVVAPDGQTVVIGGLMDNTKNSSVTKIPLLGDIPIIGAAFRHTTTSDQRTELVIFLTPHIVRRPSDLAKLSAKEQGTTPRAFSEEDLNKFIDTLPSKEIGPTTTKDSRDSTGFMPIPGPSNPSVSPSGK